MTEFDLLKLIGQADDQYILESRRRPRAKKKARWPVALAAVLAPTRWSVAHCADLGVAGTLIYHQNALWALRRVAEVWDGDGITDKYYSSMNCFNFTMSQASGLIADTAKAGNVDTYVNYVDKYLKKIGSLREDAAFHPFITNHDMDRAAGFLTPESGQMQIAANLYILGPGSPMLYYGEELGMRGSRGSANTDANRRLAMLWGDGDTVKNPTGTTYDPKNQIEQTAADQMAEERSLYSYYKRLIQIRVNNPEIARGEYKPLSVPDDKAGGFLATWQGKTVCVLHNTTMRHITVDLSKCTDLTFTEIAGIIGAEGVAVMDGTKVTLGVQTSVVLR